jgi:hypothetical protein
VAGRLPVVSASDGYGMILTERHVDLEDATYRVIWWAWVLAGSRAGEVSVMTGWYAERTPGRSAKAVIAVTLLALLLVAAVPVALLAAVVVMILGHVVGGLALFGGTVLAAGIAIALAGMSGMRHLRKLLSGGNLGVVRLDGSQYTDVAEPEHSDYANVVELDRSEYTEVR